MIFSKKTEPKQPSYKSAVERYQGAAGQLFTAPSKKLSVFEKGVWLLHDKTGMIAIVDDESIVFGEGIAAQMQRLAESFAG